MRSGITYEDEAGSTAEETCRKFRNDVVILAGLFSAIIVSSHSDRLEVDMVAQSRKFLSALKGTAGGECYLIAPPFASLGRLGVMQIILCQCKESKGFQKVTTS